MTQDKKLALVLSSGGARSAYQAGVLMGLHKIAAEEGLSEKFHFPVIAGTSGGAINGAFLACYADQWDLALNTLWNHWEQLTVESVIKAAPYPVFSQAFRLMSQLSLGGHSPGANIKELLNTEPLTEMLKKSLDFKRLRANIASGRIHGLGLTATHYATGSAVTFFQGSSQIPPWMRSHRIGKRTVLNLKHVLASSSIPLLFPPVFIHGSYYGDGAVRMPSPLSPAIHMGADKILAIGVRYYRSPKESFDLNASARMPNIQIADIMGVLMNSIFLDALDSDIERLNRINTTLKLLPKDSYQEHPEKLRQIPVLAIHPSIDLALLAKDEFHRFSWIFKHFLKGLGASDVYGSDLLSYLAFEKSYTTKLLNLGAQDALTHKRAFIEWLLKPI